MMLGSGDDSVFLFVSEYFKIQNSVIRLRVNWGGGKNIPAHFCSDLSSLDRNIEEKTHSQTPPPLNYHLPFFPNLVRTPPQLLFALLASLKSKKNSKNL